jgi:hypothetical protein
MRLFKIVGLYQWVWNIDGGFNWYAGVGGGIGSWSYDKNDVEDSGSFILAAGDIGIEYNFSEFFILFHTKIMKFHFSATLYFSVVFCSSKIHPSSGD